MRTAKLVLLSSLLVSTSVTVAQQERTWKPTDPILHNCEMNINLLSNAHHLAGDDTIIIAVARLGTGERNPEINRRRLHNVKAYLTSLGWKRRPETVVTAEGERVNGYGRIEIYVRGGHWATLAVRRNQDLIVGLCEPDYMRNLSFLLDGDPFGACGEEFLFGVDCYDVRAESADATVWTKGDLRH